MVVDPLKKPLRLTISAANIQKLRLLVDTGSAVSVTKARYVTPAGRDIHGVGLTRWSG